MSRKRKANWRRRHIRRNSLNRWNRRAKQKKDRGQEEQQIDDRDSGTQFWRQWGIFDIFILSIGDSPESIRGVNEAVLRSMMGEHDDVMAKRVATFYAGVSANDGEITSIIYAASGIAALFGAIHCIGWTFKFPSHAEQLLWRTSSIAITCLPLASRPIYLTIIWLGNYQRNGVLGWVAKFLGLSTFIATILSSIIYIIARVTLLILALTSLHSLPAEAYQTVHWTTFIPHI